MTSTYIPLSIPNLTGMEDQYLHKCIQDNWVSSVGPYVTQFEELFAEKVGAKRAVACSSGTAALHLALVAKNIKKDDLVLVSSLTFIAPVNAIRYIGAEPILVDCDQDTGQMDTSIVEDFLLDECSMVDGRCIHKETGKHVSALVPVHILGHAANMDRLLHIAEQFNLIIIEDAAEALGATQNGRQVGCFGEAGCFSFNGNKIITSGSGGMVVTNSDELADRIKYLSEQAKQPGIEYIHTEVGYNYRMSNLHAAVGLAQLEKLENHLSRKREIAERYKAGLADLSGISWIEPSATTQSAWWLFTITLEFEIAKISARELIKKLKEEGIESRPLWQPMHLSSISNETRMLGGDNAESLYDVAISLPSSVGLTNNDQDRVIHAIAKHLPYG